MLKSMLKGALLVLFTSVSILNTWAQDSQTTTLRTKILEDLATNNSRQITAEKLRSVLLSSADAIDSAIDTVKRDLNAVFTTFSLGKSIGEYDASTGVAKVTATGATSIPDSTPAFSDGQYFDVVKAGTRSITGSSVVMAVGGKIIVRGTVWGYIPPSDAALQKTIAIDGNLDDLTKKTTGRLTVNLPIPLSFTRYSSSGSVTTAGNMAQVENPDRSVVITGYTDVTLGSNITDMQTGVSSSGITKAQFDFSMSAAVTVDPMVGIGYVSGTDRVIYLWRPSGLLSYAKAGTSTFSQLIAAGAPRDYTVGDKCRMELVFSGSTVTLNLYKGTPYSLVATTTTTPSSFLPTGDFITGSRGAMSFTYYLTTEQAGDIAQSVTTANTYTDSKVTAIQVNVDSLSVLSANLIPPLFTTGSYYRNSDGGITSNANWTSVTNLIPVNGSTQYTINGAASDFFGAEFGTAGQSAWIRSIQAPTSGVHAPSVTFTTHPDTRFVGINISSNPAINTTGTVMLALGSDASRAYEKYGDKYVKGSKVRGSIPGYATKNDVITGLSPVYYSFDTDGYTDSGAGATANTGVFYVYCRYSPNSPFFARYRVARIVNTSIRADLWRIVGAGLYKWDGTQMVTQNTTLLTDTETEFVWIENGKSDFTGGFHGDELLIEIDFYANGVKITDLSADIPLTAANEFRYIQKSNMLETDNGSTVIRCIHYKNTTFKDAGFTTRNRVIWQGVAAVDICYFGLLTVTHAQAATAFTENYNYVNNTATATPGIMRINETGAHDINYYHPGNGLGAFTTSRVTKAINGSTDNTASYDNGALLKLWDVSMYAKYYRQISSKTTTAGEMWEGETTYRPYRK